MMRTDIPRIATILADASWMDRLDLTSPSASERERAALMLAAHIVARLEGAEASDADPRQMALPIQ
jgi:hypothetical protein